mgnify:CR=1 FL=1
MLEKIPRVLLNIILSFSHKEDEEALHCVCKNLKHIVIPSIIYIPIPYVPSPSPYGMSDIEPNIDLYPSITLFYIPREIKDKIVELEMRIKRKTFRIDRAKRSREVCERYGLPIADWLKAGSDHVVLPLMKRKLFDLKSKYEPQNDWLHSVLYYNSI